MRRKALLIALGVSLLALIIAGVFVLRPGPGVQEKYKADVGRAQTERERSEQLFPQHRTVLLEQAAHFIQEDAPKEIMVAVREWFAQRGGVVLPR